MDNQFNNGIDNISIIQNISYVVASIKVMWLFIHASNLLPSLATPLPYKTWWLRAKLEVEGSRTNQERSCLEAVQADPTTNNMAEPGQAL